MYDDESSIVLFHDCIDTKPQAEYAKYLLQPILLSEFYEIYSAKLQLNIQFFTGEFLKALGKEIIFYRI